MWTGKKCEKSKLVIFKLRSWSQIDSCGSNSTVLLRYANFSSYVEEAKEYFLFLTENWHFEYNGKGALGSVEYL